MNDHHITMKDHHIIMKDHHIIMKDHHIIIKKEKQERKKETQSYDKTPYTNRKFENQKTTHKRHQNFDYTTIADRFERPEGSHGVPYKYIKIM